MAEAKVTITLIARNLATKTFDGLKSAVRSVKEAVFSLQGALASLGVALTAGTVINFLVRVNRETGKLMTQLQTFEGSSKAAKAVFNDLAQFAAKTPFQIGELVEAYVGLRTRGIKPTMETMQLLGDHAAAMGVKINDAIIAISSAASGEFEPMARTLGVKMRVVGDQLIATFNGVQTHIGRDTQSIIRYLEDLSRKNFAGGMERQAKTIDGALSNLTDAAESLARRIGESGFTDIVANLAVAMTNWTNSLIQNDAPLRKWFGLVQDSFPVIVAEFKQLGGELDLSAAKWELVKAELAGVGAVLKAMATLGEVPLDVDARVAAAKADLKAAEAKIAAAKAEAQAARVTRSANAAVNARGSRLQQLTAKAAANADSLTAAELREFSQLQAAAAAGATGIAATGHATAPTDVVDPNASGKAEQGRKKIIDDLIDQAALLQQQIELRIAGNDALDKSVSLETRLALLMGKNGTTPAEQLQLLKAAGELRQSRMGVGLMTVGESTDAMLRKMAFGEFSPEAIGNRADRAEMNTVGMANRMVVTPRGIVDKGSLSFSQKIGKSIKDAVGESQTLNQIIADMATNTLRGFGDAVETAFERLADGSVEAGHAFASAMLGAIGEVASGLGQLALGKAAMALGDGLLSGKPTDWAAVGQYLAAATALFAVAGAFKGQASIYAARGSRSGGRSSASSANNSLNGAAGEGTLIIEGDPVLDMSNVRTERRVKAALETFGRRKIRVKKNFFGSG